MISTVNILCYKFLTQLIANLHFIDIITYDTMSIIIIVRYAVDRCVGLQFKLTTSCFIQRTVTTSDDDLLNVVKFNLMYHYSVIN